jgi:hypothetical protein
LLTLPAARPEPRAPDVHGYWGVAIGMYPEEAHRRAFPFPPDLEEVAELGASHVMLAIPWHSHDLHASSIGPGAESIDDGTFLRVAARVREAGMAPVVMPFVRLEHAARDEWRGVIDPADRDLWWRSYRDFILHYARLSRVARAPLFAIGSELSSMTGPEDASHWRALARDVRAVFPGRLAYVSNHDALDRRAAFSSVDVVGVSAYFELTDDPDASEEVLERAWRSIAARLSRFAGEVRRPVVLFELGYPSSDGGAVHPWDYTLGSMLDLEEQRRAYHASIEAILDTPAIEGALFWTWFGPGGPDDRWYTPRAKPAEGELRRLLHARAR